MSDENIFRGFKRTRKPNILVIGLMTIAIGITANLLKSDKGPNIGLMDDMAFESAANATAAQLQTKSVGGPQVFYLIGPEKIEYTNGVATVRTWFLTANDRTRWTVSHERISIPQGQEYSTNMFFRWYHGRFCQIK